MNETSFQRSVFSTQSIASIVGSSNLTACIDTTASDTALTKVRSYMQTLFAQEIELHPDTTATFVTNAGNNYDELQWQCVDDDMAWNITLQCDSDMLLPLLLFDSTLIDTIASGIYYYHTDHLGGASWITDNNGEPIQYIHYMPYGELWVNQRNSTYDERYKFTGKERDEETGYDFFGARNYSSAITTWLSPDPLLDKYPNISPYAYAAWNPIKYVDPDGRVIVVGTWYGRAFAKLGFNNFEAKVMAQLKELKDMDPELNKMITDLEDPSIDLHIKYDNNKNNHYDPKTKEIGYDPDDYIRKDGDKRPPEAALAHELGHAENDKNGTSVKYNKRMANGEIGTPSQQTNEQVKRDKNEANSIYYENIVREKKEYPQRGYNYSAGD